MSFTPHEVYSRSLLGTHGYPLWTPQLKTQLRESYQLEGLKIGDVGIVSSNDGSFDVLFNITLERNEQPYPELVREDFTPIILDQQRDLATQPDAVAAHGVISSDSVELMSQEVHSCDQEPPRAEYEFSLSMEEGAVLILPEGAQSFDLANEKIFLGEAIRHGIDWYERATEEAGRLISNDSLYLITGFHKARSWSVGAAGRIRPNIQKSRSVKFKIGQVDQGRATARAYQWAATRCFTGRIGPTHPYEIANYACNERLRHGVNQTVFVRGFRITVNKILFLKTVSVKTRQGTFFGFGTYIDKLWGGPSESTPSSGAGPTDNAVDQDSSMDHSQLYMDPRMTIDRLSDVSMGFHPGDLINRYMLKKEPRAMIALTHDSVWIEMLRTGLLELADFSSEKRLEEVLSKNCQITVEDGAVYLEGSSRRHSEWTLPSSPLSGSIQTPGLSDLYPECTGREQAKDEALGLGDRPQDAPTYSSSATHASEEGGTTITSIRATDVALDLRQVPSGFHAIVRHSGLKWRTENKRLSANEDVEWSGPIPVPSDLSATVCLEVFASFRFQPMLGAGERVQKLVASVQQLLDRSENNIPFTFFRNDGGIVSRRSSILVTVKRQKGESGSSTLGVLRSVQTSLKIPTDVISVQSPEGVIHSDVTQTISESAPFLHPKMSPNTSRVGRNLDSRYREATTPPSSGVSSSEFLISPSSTVESPKGESLGERGEEEGRHSTTATARAGETRLAHGHQNKPKKGKEVQRPKRSRLTGHVAPLTSRKLPAQPQCPAQPEGAGEKVTMSIISSGSSRSTSDSTRKSRAETSVNKLNAIQPSTGSAHPPQEQPPVSLEGFSGRVTASGTTLNPSTRPWKSIVVANSSSEEYETPDGEDSQEWTSEEMDEAEIRLREAVLEAWRQRELFAKVPQRLYSNLNRTQSGLLSQITAISSSNLPPSSVMKWQESEKEAPRPKGPPKEQEMEDDSGDDVDDKIQMSQSVAQQKLQALMSRRSSDGGTSHLTQPVTMEVSPGMLSSSTALIPLGHPYNLPAAGVPMIPRTTRRGMLKTELSESTRRQLLWERQVSSNNNPALVARRATPGMGGLRPVTSDSSDGIKDTTTINTEAQDEDERRRRAMARSRSWADDYHYSGW